MRVGFGVTKQGEEAFLYQLKNSHGCEAWVSDYGANLVKLLVPDRDGKKRDVVLGYADVSGYEKNGGGVGAVIGRVANRIGGAQFELNGQVYHLTANNNGNTLHSGRDFMNQRMWTAEQVSEQSVTLLLHSPDGDQGYPGNVDIRVTYTLTEENELQLKYHGVPDADTLMNLTNHSYFHLGGHDAGDAMGQEVQILADAYTRADEKSIPTGEIVPVEGTPMDFRQKKRISRDIEADYEALKFGCGYDHNWVLSGTGYRKVAEMSCEESGITMEVMTDLPGMQFYTANFLGNVQGKDGVIYGRRQGVCFETQYFPDAVHKENFEGPVVRAGEVYETRTAYKFSVE